MRQRQQALDVGEERSEHLVALFPACQREPLLGRFAGDVDLDQHRQPRLIDRANSRCELGAR